MPALVTQQFNNELVAQINNIQCAITQNSATVRQKSSGIRQNQGNNGYTACCLFVVDK